MPESSATASLSPGRAIVSRKNSIAWFVAALALLATVLFWQYQSEREQEAASREFTLLTDDIAVAIRKRMLNHEQILLGGAGLMDASGRVSRVEWRVMVERLRLSENYPGILGVGYAQAVAPEGLEDFEERVRAEGFPDFQVHPVGPRPFYTSILFLEPFRDRNLAAFGYDMFSEPVRRAAMQAAAESGHTRMTGPVRLLQETHGEVQAGILMYTPIYHRGAPLDTPAQRQRALRGFVYSPYRMGDLLEGILGSRTPGVRYRITDTEAGLDFPQLYSDLIPDSAKATHQRTLDIHLYGRNWRLEFASTPSFERTSGPSPWVLLLGLASALLLFALASMLVLRREQAERIAHQMTRRLRASNEALRQSEERKRLALQGSNDGWWDVDLQTWHFLASDRAWEMIGYPPQDAAQSLHRWQSVLAPQARHQLISALRGVIQSQQGTFAEETRLTHQTGHSIPVLLRGIVQRDEDGKALRASGTMQDLTEAKRVEQLKSQFVSTVSHELRTPLTSISGALAIVNSGSLGPVPEAMQRMLEIAQDNSQRLNLLINDLLDMEKLAAGKMQFEMRPCALTELIDEALTANQAFAASRDVSLQRQGDCACWVRVDSMRLHQILNNYLSNAIKFSPAESVVTVETERDGDQVTISVIDQGEGIPLAFQEQIFSKFAQADSSDRRQQAGTGLGLAITRELAQQMDGEVGFSSLPGHGATFWLRLPVEAAEEQPADAPDDGAERTVLVVDDDPMIAEFVALVVRRAGYIPTTATSVAQARSCLQRHSYTALLTDLRLQDGHGLTLIRDLRADPASEALPILVLSAYCEEGQRLLQNGSEDSALAWLDKPVDEKKLVSVLEELVTRCRATAG